MTNSVLKSVDFVRPTGEYIPGLVSVRDQNAIKSLSIDEQAVVFEARSFKHIDFVFFRRFSDSRSSQVAAYVVDNSNSRLDKNSLSELHHQVWLQGTVPLLYIAGDSQIDILACARGPDFWNKGKQRCQYKPAKEFKFDLLTAAGEISDEMKRFSALRLADGTFWDDPDNRDLANHDKAAHQSLIQAVVEADKDLDGKNNCILRRLLLLMVLVKYLEDRAVFPTGWFGRFHKGAKNFFDVLQGGDVVEVNRLLTFLEGKFNGDVFDLSLLGSNELTKATLKRFADLVDARTLKRQLYLWRQFSFKHLPVEIISHLYQRFVEEGHGAVYTPHFLASLLLDHVMPYKGLTGEERILDPGCGSAVFLVGAFRRLVNLWRSQHNWKRPTVERLKKILKNSIYGIDLDSSAIDLSAFSLSLAICDALKPKVIWNKLKFDRLRDSNLFEKDFFDLLLDSRKGVSNFLERKFDIVIGNPPFESELTDEAKQIDKITQRSEPSRGNCPDNNLAYLFLEQALTLLRPENGRVCLIQPSGLLYNINTNKFRTSLFKKCQTGTVFDFTSIRNLYDAADPKTIAVSANNGNPTSDHYINHWTFRRTVSVKEKICFELDHYDHHRITQDQAETNPYIWRADLLGGGRLIDISKRFQRMQTLLEYIQNKDWRYAEGFIIGKNGGPASFLTGERYLPTEEFTTNEIAETKFKEIKAKRFVSPKKKEQFEPPLILIKENQSLPMVFWNKHFLGYKDKIVGIHAPRSAATELSQVYESLVKNQVTYRFCCMLNGTQSLVGKSTAILKRDIDLLPYPEDEKNLSLSFWEKALCDEAIDNMADYIRLGQNSDLLQKSADKVALRQYAQMYVKMLGSIYSDLRASKPIFLNSLICQPFYFGDSPELNWIEEGGEPELSKLIYYEEHARLRTVRVVRFYDRNVILVVKPDRLRYWIRSTAVRDADETFEDLCDQGY
jgi:hypothetical protein